MPGFHAGCATRLLIRAEYLAGASALSRYPTSSLPTVVPGLAGHASPAQGELALLSLSLHSKCV